ncbi:hypothetical protein [Mariniblastus fucicola]|uniref:Response regulatory domain-containing protein n=1 Tax=Mariniblastus fucicola TaxID=980251 RepID=A0A5B9PE72_9BACT|nr:hypothetical protein [Mariniblastus fucicola]QEG24708.1 hypothetical protein MFFC18_46300 [Mariniblastus fucicola]
MKDNALPVAPSIAVATQTPRWRSQVQRGIDSARPMPQVHWLLDFDSARNFIVSNECAALIVELPDGFSERPQQVLERVADLCNNPQHCPLFLLAAPSADPWRAVLAEAGATETCCSVLDFVKMWPRVERHLKTCLIGDLSVEEKVIARLPW